MSVKHWIVLTLVFATGPALSAAIDAQSINEAQWSEKKPAQGAISPLVVKLQVLLDRAHFSPAEIDVPKMEDMKDLPALSYTDVKEKLAEQFHMSPELLVALNPDQKFDKAGGVIMVANVSGVDLREKAARIEVDKSKQTLKVFGKSGSMLAMYSVTAGSTEKPAPEGTLKVTSVAKNPTYRYNPEYAFKGVKSKEPFTIKPGPNNPVGLVWIGLNKEGYGIHGTPEPSKVSKSESHGCVRLTNWDALQLASATTKGVVVEFIGNEADRQPAQAQTHKIKPHRRR